MSTPTRRKAAVFRAKTLLLQLRRAAADSRDRPPRFPAEPEDGSFPICLAESRTPLWTESGPAERWLQRGKVENLRRAARLLDGRVIPAGGPFSFWRHVGRATRRRGFVPGRELREGCLVPSVGGGLCQLSNALYDTALRAGCTITERHAHSRVIPYSAAAQGRDATVFWNYVDLRFRPPQAVRLSVRLTADELTVAFRAAGRPAVESPTPAPVDHPALPVAARRAGPLLVPAEHSCISCGATDCFRHRSGRDLSAGITAFVLDSVWPEAVTYLGSERRVGDHLLIPLDGRRWRISRYAWPTEGWARVATAPLPTLRRSFEARGQLPPPALRARHLQGEERLAAALARHLPADATHLVIALPLLPYLWREGHLGGRRYTVLLNRWPLVELHRRLDEALARHPERGLLGDFRASPALVATETEALAHAETLVTPHAAIAALFGPRVRRVPWALPQLPPAATPGPAVAFAGPTAARKGAYTVREAARRLGLTVVLRGSELEGTDFWRGVEVRRAASLTDWLTGVRAAVQPAIVEDAPRPLLAALAAGTPVLAAAACGLGEHPLVTTLPSDDTEALVESLVRA